MPWDAVIIGAGAAGLFCASIAGQRGLRVLLIDHAGKLAEKIRISGGGRCNFTNRDAGPANFLSENPAFCRSALARYTPADFVALVQRHRIAFHEKHKGQLFCDGSSDEIISMLVRECEAGGVTRWQPCAVQAVRQADAGFALDTDRGAIRARRLVVATGGLSIPKIGASDWGYRLARRIGHHVIEPRPALVPLTFDAQAWAPFAALSGLSLEVGIRNDAPKGACGRFVEDLLFTHRGLSGPAVLQVSSFWRPGQALEIDLAPTVDLAAVLRAAKAASKRRLGNELALHLPQRLADTWLAQAATAAGAPGRPKAAGAPSGDSERSERESLQDRAMPELRDRELDALAGALKHWRVMPTGSEGWRKAEVTAGGVDTRELSSQTMESRRMPGLYFIGEVVDVTGWLGGYNFQWAWASAAACGRAMG